MKVTRFDPAADLLVVPGFIWGPGGGKELRLALDTGAGETLVIPGILDEVGYSARDGEAITKIRSAVAEEPGYLLRIRRFRALAHEFADFRVHAHDLPDGFGIHGLLGLSFLRHFNYEVRSLERRVLVERAS